MRRNGPDHHQAALSRRSFCATGPALMLAAYPGTVSASPIGPAPEAADIVAALSAEADTTLLAGRAGAGVRGVAMLPDPTLAALGRAVAGGASLILSPESPFYARTADPADPNSPFAAMAARATAALHDSPAWRAKRAFVADHDLTIYRLTPQVRGRDVAAEAIAARLGWAAHRIAGEHPIYAPPGLTVAGLVRAAHTALHATGGLRFIGDPAMPLGSVLIVPGTAEVVATTQALRHADALLTGDVREWEVVTYVHDSIAAGLPKALVATGRILSEQPFVDACAATIRQRFPGLPLHADRAADPFWRIQA